MDEIELRLAALEMLLIEWLALEDEGRRLQIEASVKRGIPAKGEPGFGGAEHNVRRHVLTLVQDARARHDVFGASGVMAPKGD